MIDKYFDYFGLNAGVLMIVGAGILIFLIIAIIAERRTRILFPNRQEKAAENGDDEITFFDDID